MTADPLFAELERLARALVGTSEAQWDNDQPDAEPWAILAADVLRYRAMVPADQLGLLRLASALEETVRWRIALETAPDRRAGIKSLFQRPIPLHETRKRFDRHAAEMLQRELVATIEAAEKEAQCPS